LTVGDASTFSSTVNTTGVTLTTSPSNNITGLTLSNNDYLYIRFIFSGGSNSDLFSIDDVTITPILASLSTTYTTSWSNNSPTSSIDAIIDGDLISSTDISCKNLTINAGKSLTISSADRLTVNGNIVNNGTLTLESGATLVQGTGNTVTGSGGIFNVKQALTGVVQSGGINTPKFGKAETTNDLIATPTGYGDRILLAGEDTFALNNDDTVIAGTNLFPNASTGGSNMAAKIDELIAEIRNQTRILSKRDNTFGAGINSAYYG
jgi:hypothetical protein